MSNYTGPLAQLLLRCKLHSHIAFFFRGALFLGLIVSCEASVGQVAEIGPQSVEDTNILQSIDAGLTSIATNTQLDETQKSNVENLFQRAKQALTSANQLSNQSRQYSDMVDNVVETASATESAIEQLAGAELDVNVSASIDELTQQLGEAQGGLAKATKDAATAAAEPARRKKRLAEIPAEVSAAEQELRVVNEQLNQPPPANESPVESQARVALLQARRIELESKIETLNQEQSAYVATTELMAEQKTLADLRVSQSRQKVEQIRQLLTEKQKVQAQGEANQLKRTVELVPDNLRELASSNVSLAEQHEKLILDASAATERLEKIQEAFTEVKADLASSADRVEAVGLTDALGVMLRDHREDYEKLRAEYRPSADLKQRIQDYQIDSFQIEDQLRKLDEQLLATDEQTIAWDAKDIVWSELSLEEAGWVLRKQRRKLLADLLQSKNGLLQTMLTSDTQQRELLQAIDRFNDFVDQKLFWTRSSAAISLAELEFIPKASLWFIDPANWQSAASSIYASAAARPLRAILCLVLCGVAIYFRSNMRRIIAGEGKTATRFNASYRSTLVTLGATAAAATVWPISFWSIGYFLSASPVGNAFARGLGLAFGVVGVFVASRELLKETCRSGGLADAHFGWSANVCSHLRRHLRWYTLLGGVAVVLMISLSTNSDSDVRTLGTRYSAALLFLVTAFFHHVVLGSRSPIYVQLVQVNSESIIYRWRRVIWWLAVVLPIGFAVLALAGYIETTLRLGRSMQSTFLLLVVVVIGLGLVSRWLTLQKRDLARKRAKESRERAAAKSEESGFGEGVGEVGIVFEEETSTSLPVLDQQTRQSAFAIATVLGCVGLAYIWSDVLPALDFFDGIAAWQLGTGENIETVSLLDIAYSVFGVIATFFAARNLPSMLELLILGRTSLDSGARYAICTLLRYVIFTVGAFFVLNLLAVPYNQLGWLLAAASVGLGFGLQEIVANFVSGVILLLERPVRVGDVVTIDGTTGIVSRIQMRATTVTSWDRKELVVPNKDLITQKLLNWSLSNVINRLTIHVGVDYEADPDEVRQILKKVVTDHPDVMEDPPPLINLESFGDSSLVFHIRFFLAKLETRIETTHQINAGIARALKAAGISIPFPQRDLNLKISQDQADLPISVRRSR